MQAATNSVREVLTRQLRFVIPTYQRDYEWTQDEQWELLFDDLFSTASRLHEARAGDAVAGTSKLVDSLSPHFLGAVVFEQLKTSTSAIAARSVIDGQQRITTLQLLVRGLLDALEGTGSKKAAALRSLIWNPADLCEEDHERFKLWPRLRDRRTWMSVMDDAPTDLQHPYADARRYFHDAASTAAAELPLDVIVDALLTLFHLVVIDLDANDDAQVIFEVLNGRQTPLSAADLMKNLLFLREDIQNEAMLEKLYTQYWQEFDNDWWRKRTGRGHAQRGRREQLISAWLTVSQGAEVNIGHLYGAARTYLSDPNLGTDQVLAELHTYGQHFRSLYERTGAEATVGELRLRRILDVLGVTTAIPLLLWLKMLPSSRLSAAEYDECVSTIEGWLVRRAIMNWSSRSYGKVFLEVLSKLQASSESTDPIPGLLLEILRNKPGNLDFPTDEEFSNVLTGTALYKQSKPRVRMILAGLDEHMRTRETRHEQYVVKYDKLQIEHVMPQAWATNWPLPSAKQSETATAARNSAIQTLGNLTLLTQKLNGEQSNKGWDEKRDLLETHSSLLISKSLHKSKSWSENDIERRGRALAEMACQIWKGPN